MDTARKATKQVPEKTRVFILDDHPVVRHGFTQRINLETDMEFCGEAATAHDALRLVEELKPHVIMVDISLDEGDGLDVIRNLTARSDDIKILVVSSHDESIYAERCIRAGAHGYLQKSEAIDKVVEAIRHVLTDECYLSDAITSRALKWIIAGSAGPGGDGLESLSDRELQVYQLIGQGKTVNQIAEKLFLSPKTIETYRAHLKVKLQLKNSNELTHHAIRWVMEHA